MKIPLYWICLFEGGKTKIKKKTNNPVAFSLVSKATHMHASILSEVISLPKCVCQFQGISLASQQGEKESNTPDFL